MYGAKLNNFARRLIFYCRFQFEVTNDSKATVSVLCSPSLSPSQKQDEQDDQDPRSSKEDD